MLAAAGALTLAAGCTGSPAPEGSIAPTSATSSSPAATGVVDAAASTVAQTLPIQSVGEAPSSDGVADGVLAPTNRWYSALAYADLPAKAYPTPVAVQVDAGSIGIALPSVVGSDALIAAQTGAFLTVAVGGSDARPQVTVNDPVYTSLAYSGPDGPLATATVAQGWPAIGLVADADVTLTLSSAPTWGDDGVGRVELEGTTYGVTASRAQVDGASVTLAAGGWLQVFPIPSGDDATGFTDPAGYAALMSSPVTTATSKWAVGTQTTTTTLAYSTVDGGPTVLVPSAAVDGTSPDGTCDIGLFDTIDGPTVACAGTALAWDVTTVTPQLTLDVSGLTAEQKQAVTTALDAEAGGVAYPSDTYFGSKAMYRDAQLLALADDLGDTAASTQIGERLATELDQWTDPEGCTTRTSRCFVYDDAWGGVVGLDTAFGSEQFNDHHFHYGYLIYAATIAVQEGIVDIDAIAPVIDSLVADIASPGTSEVPAIRVFDPFAGHSWASGTSPFADGNNQESSSEAITAWTAVAAWAQLRGDAGAATRAQWMLSAEAHSSLALYVRPDTSFAPEYTHLVVGIEWGAKRDYATWFSADPAAMLGIQLIPMAPTQIGILTPADDTAAGRATASIAEAMPTGTADQFTDLITMYTALGGAKTQAAAWAVALTLPDSAIDDGMSRAYMLAFIASVG
ncbi:glycosyl hydrolase [Demequina capsici]|uniref:glucan endo-1,3-beta-D-glucosidase n=1 Tax=Demequina capsici TaxID=3075620 RepID=A0AA96FCG7_9MICO|nr:glycosyl hydrolase [Demequina sp. OYTSA14]WNM25991.1 glycosyl hydrolase [Demequina sp. OYTSA14]